MVKHSSKTCSFASIVYLFICYILCFSNPVQAEITTVTVEVSVFEQAKKILDGQNVLTLDTFAHPLCQRDFVEFILVQQALDLGGFRVRFDYKKGNFDARNIRLVESGFLLINFDTVWLSELEHKKSDVFISSPMIRKGEYYAGVYTSEKNYERVKNNIKHDLSKVSFITSDAWYADVVTLKKLKAKSIEYEAKWVALANLVTRGWVDAMLVSFNNSQPFYYEGDNYKIRAINGLKVPIQDSRHFIISKKHPLGKQAFIALNKGLAIMRDKGLITKAYTECGFFNDTVENWREIVSAN